MSSGNKICLLKNPLCTSLMLMPSNMVWWLIMNEQNLLMENLRCLDLLLQSYLMQPLDTSSLVCYDEWSNLYHHKHCLLCASCTFYRSTFRNLLRRTKMKFGFTPEAETLNGRLAMLGFVIAVGTYLTTGQIVPGVFWDPNKISNNTHPHSKYEWGT